jgi:hypothetical protein
MNDPPPVSTEESQKRTLHFLTHPDEWPWWPFLPLVRRTRGEEELGVVYDALHAADIPGHTSTVYLTNLFTIPTTQAAFFALPHEAFDSPEEVLSAGWSVD